MLMQATTSPSVGRKVPAQQLRQLHEVSNNLGTFFVLFGDVYSAKPKSLHDGFSVAHVPAVQNLADVRAMDAMTVCKCSLAPLAFKRRFQQNKRVVVIKHARLPA